MSIFELSIAVNASLIVAALLLISQRLRDIADAIKRQERP